MHINQLKESNYLKKEDCDPPILVTIKGDLTQENVAMEGKPEDLKWAIHFKEVDKPMILNSTNGQLIAMATGSENSEDWDGKVIVLYNDPNVSFQGKLVGGIRVRAPKKTKQGNILPPAQQTEPDDSDQLPF
jgi:hypothetical protein